MTNEQLKHIVSLAKLNIKEDEFEKYKTELEAIMKEIEKINDLDVNTPPQISNHNKTNIYFNDEVAPSLTKEEIFKNAKTVVGDYIAVPKVIE